MSTHGWDLLCGHWTFYGDERVARCDLPADHDGMHRYWTNAERGESFLWSNRGERHMLSAAVPESSEQA